MSMGFGGTDTNKIARRGGFAPENFYRWRSLRQLLVENDAVRQARAESRITQIAYAKTLSPKRRRDVASPAAILLVHDSRTA
jgi:hypothetical protein